MTKSANPPATRSAALHAERIAQAGQRTEREEPPAGQSTAQLYAARILPGYAADEALREEARKNDKRTRGEWVPDEADELDDGEEYEELLEDEEGEERPGLTTAQRYAAIEMKRRAAEHKANLVAHRSVGQAAMPPVTHRHAEQLAQPYRPAS